MEYVVKLQGIRRRDGTVFYVVIPKRIVEKLGWVKGDELLIEGITIGTNLVEDKEWNGILISRVRDVEEYKRLTRKYKLEKLVEE